MGNYDVRLRTAGNEQRRLAEIIAGYYGMPVERHGTDCEVCGIRVEQDGTMVLDGRMDTEEVEELLELIAEAGFDFQDEEAGA